MKLTKKQLEKLKKLDIVKAAREARDESAHLLNNYLVLELENRRTCS